MEHHDDTLSTSRLYVVSSLFLMSPRMIDVVLHVASMRYYIICDASHLLNRVSVRSQPH